MSLKKQFVVSVVLLVGGCAVEVGDATLDTEALSQSESQLCRNALSASQEATALKLIDDICGDTWCEGDNNFAFEHLTCRRAPTDSPDGGRCTLKLRLIPRVDNPRSYARTCTTGGFQDFDSLVETAQNGYQSLDWDYYLALTECISELESALPR